MTSFENNVEIVKCKMIISVNAWSWLFVVEIMIVGTYV